MLAVLSIEGACSEIISCISSENVVSFIKDVLLGQVFLWSGEQTTCLGDRQDWPEQAAQPEGDRQSRFGNYARVFQPDNQVL